MPKNDHTDPHIATLSNKFIGKRRVMFDLTTTEYWDCECEKNFIHSADQERCPICGALRDEQPDSRLVEVLGAGLEIKHLHCWVMPPAN